MLVRKHKYIKIRKKVKIVFRMLTIVMKIEIIHLSV